MSIRLDPLARGSLADGVVRPAFKQGHGGGFECACDPHLQRLRMSGGMDKATAVFAFNERDGKTLGKSVAVFE